MSFMASVKRHLSAFPWCENDDTRVTGGAGGSNAKGRDRQAPSMVSALTQPNTGNELKSRDF